MRTFSALNILKGKTRASYPMFTFHSEHLPQTIVLVLLAFLQRWEAHSLSRQTIALTLRAVWLTLACSVHP